MKKRARSWKRDRTGAAQRRTPVHPEIVAETSMNTKEADAIPEEMTVKGYVMMDVTDSGRAILYTFPGIVEKAQQEKQEWFKHEVTRETGPRSRRNLLSCSDGQGPPSGMMLPAAALLFLSLSSGRSAPSLPRLSTPE